MNHRKFILPTVLLAPMLCASIALAQEEPPAEPAEDPVVEDMTSLIIEGIEARNPCPESLSQMRRLERKVKKAAKTVISSGGKILKASGQPPVNPDLLRNELATYLEECRAELDDSVSEPEPGDESPPAPPQPNPGEGEGGGNDGPGIGNPPGDGNSAGPGNHEPGNHEPGAGNPPGAGHNDGPGSHEPGNGAPPAQDGHEPGAGHNDGPGNHQPGDGVPPGPGNHD